MVTDLAPEARFRRPADDWCARTGAERLSITSRAPDLGGRPAGRARLVGRDRPGRSGQGGRRLEDDQGDGGDADGHADSRQRAWEAHAR